MTDLHLQLGLEDIEGHRESPQWMLSALPIEGQRKGHSMGNTGKPKLKLVGEDGNALSILGRAKKALEEVGREDEFQDFMVEATAGDYDHLLRVTMKWFEVE